MSKRIVFVGAGAVGGISEVGIPAPTHAAITDVVKRVERGELDPGPENVAHI